MKFRFNLIKTAKESYLDYISLILLELLSLFTILGLLFSVELSIIKFVSILILSLLFICLLAMIFINFYKMIKFQSKTDDLFLIYDENKVSSVTKNGEFSLKYKDIENLIVRKNYLPFSLLKDDVRYVLQIAIKKENVAWYKKLMKQEYVYHELYVNDKDYKKLVDLMEKYKEKK